MAKPVIFPNDIDMFNTFDYQQYDIKPVQSFLM